MGTNYKSISNEVMKTVNALEQSLASNQKLKLSLIAINNFDQSEQIKKSDYVSPENWDYWQV